MNATSTETTPTVTIADAKAQVNAWDDVHSLRKAVVLAVLEVADEYNYGAAFEWFEDNLLAHDMLADSALYFDLAATLAQMPATELYAWCDANTSIVRSALADAALLEWEAA